MIHEFETNYTPQVCEQGVNAYWRRMFGWRTAMQMAVCVAVFYFVAPHSPGWVIGALFTGMGFYMVLAVAGYVWQKRNMLAMQRAMTDTRVTWQLGEKKLEVKTADGNSELDYSAIQEIYQQGDIWLLFVSRRAFTVLPVLRLPAEVRGFLQRKVMDAGGRIT